MMEWYLFVDVIVMIFMSCFYLGFGVIGGCILCFSVVVVKCCNVLKYRCFFLKDCLIIFFWIVICSDLLIVFGGCDKMVRCVGFLFLFIVFFCLWNMVRWMLYCLVIFIKFFCVLNICYVVDSCFVFFFEFEYFIMIWNKNEMSFGLSKNFICIRKCEYFWIWKVV